MFDSLFEFCLWFWYLSPVWFLFYINCLDLLRCLLFCLWNCVAICFTCLRHLISCAFLHCLFECWVFVTNYFVVWVFAVVLLGFWLLLTLLNGLGLIWYWLFTACLGLRCAICWLFSLLFLYLVIVLLVFGWFVVLAFCIVWNLLVWFLGLLKLGIVIWVAAL